MAEDGRASGVQTHVEIQVTATGYASSVHVQADLAAPPVGYASGVHVHADLATLPVGYFSGIVVMVEYNDSPLRAKPVTLQGYNTQGGSGRIQGSRGRRRVGQWVPKKATLDG